MQASWRTFNRLKEKHEERTRETHSHTHIAFAFFALHSYTYKLLAQMQCLCDERYRVTNSQPQLATFSTSTCILFSSSSKCMTDTIEYI